MKKVRARKEPVQRRRRSNAKREKGESGVDEELTSQSSQGDGIQDPAGKPVLP